MIDFTKYNAAIWRGKKAYLKPVAHIDKITLDSLVGLEDQKETLIQNTKDFIKGKRYNHALLWGSRGTGKSALIKSMLNKYKSKGLRVIQISKSDFDDLPDIVDVIREIDFKFIIFCDDMSFEKDDYSYKGLKPILEGSIEESPKNVVIYATSNRRHLISEYQADNDGTAVEDGEIHYSDAIEEKISLSDRFGLWISFYQGSYEEYLKIVDSYFKDFTGDWELLHKKAKEFAMLKASRGGRTAKQFFNSYKEGL